MGRRFIYISIFAIAVFVANYSGVQAQTVNDQAQQNSTRIIQQNEQQQIQQQFNRDFNRDLESLTNKPAMQKEAIEESDTCIQVDRINLSGNETLRSKDFASLLNEYRNRCLSLTQINSLVEEITNIYIEKGYITSKTYIPAQDLSDGTLDLVIVEGELESIKYQDGRRSEIDYTFPNREERILNLRDIEQGLDQLNRLPSNNATMDLLPGSTRGASILHIKNSKTAHWNRTVGVDNLGTDSTGEWQAFASASYDNPFNISDSLLLNAKHDLDTSKRTGSRNFGLAYDVPYGYWNYFYSFNYFDYVSEFSSGALTFKNNGRSVTHNLGANRVLFRNDKGITRGKFSLTAKQNENYLENTRLDVSSRKLTMANLGLSQSYNIPNGFLFGNLTFTNGLNWLGAEDDSDNGSGGPKAQFQKFTFDIRAIKNLDLGWQRYNPLIDVTGRYQYSADNLYGTEQITAGGPYSVRGFKRDNLSGNTGGYVQTDISIPFSINNLEKTVGRFRPFIGFDIGHINSDENNGVQGGTVTSMTYGLKNEGGKFDFEVALADPLVAPAFIEKESKEIYFRISTKF